MDHTISGQGTGISTLDHSATTPRAISQLTEMDLSQLTETEVDTV